MNKKVWLAICATLLLIVGGFLLLRQDSPKAGKLKVDGVAITEEAVTLYPDYAMLPLIAVMESLDMDVVWLDSQRAEVICTDKNYILDLSAVTLAPMDEKTNLLLPPPGGERVYTVLDQELLLDDNTVKSMLYLMGLAVNIRIDYEDGVAYLTTDRES